ncbi:uncharacterized protein PpBr36_09705, partial [Pyricularia pennisetigena]|uniref:uncharacterized protein n=1 Tax=Pyricularia pennisetigena TaxID=1578925 RepID=UPI00114FA042
NITYPPLFGRQATVEAAMVETNAGGGDAVQASATSPTPEHAPISHSENAVQDYPQPNLNPELFVVASRDPVVEAAGKKGEVGSGTDGETPNSHEEEEEEEEEETYPEGGLRAWLVVLGSWMALVSSLGLMNTIGVLQSYVAQNQLSSYSEGTVGWIFSIYTFLSFGMGLYIGPIFDKYGPRWLILLGTLLLATGTMILSICTEFWHFVVAFSLVDGLGTAFMFTPAITAIGHWFRDRRGLATGIASTGGGVGGVVFPLMLSDLFERVGWAWAVRVLGFVSIALAVAANFLIRSRLPPAKNASAHPDPRIFRNVAFSLTTAGIFLMEFALFIPLGYISLYAKAQGFSAAFSFQILTVLNAASVLGRALPGWWADIIGPANANIIAILQSLIACLAIWLPAGGTTAGIVVFAILFGFASGTNISLTPLCIGRLCKTQNYGRYYATAYTLVSFACLVGIPIGGNILAACGGDYWGLIVFTGLLYLLSLVFFVAAKVYSVGWKPWVFF